MHLNSCNCTMNYFLTKYNLIFYFFNNIPSIFQDANTQLCCACQTFCAILKTVIQRLHLLTVVHLGNCPSQIHHHRKGQRAPWNEIQMLSQKILTEGKQKACITTGKNKAMWMWEYIISKRVTVYAGFLRENYSSAVSLMPLLEKDSPYALHKNEGFHYRCWV